MTVAVYILGLICGFFLCHSTMRSKGQRLMNRIMAEALKRTMK